MKSLLCAALLAIPLGAIAQSPLPVSSSTDASSANAFSANAATADVVVARFFVDIDGLESEYPDDAKAGGLLPRVIHGVQNAKLAREAVQTLRTPDGTPVKVAHDSMYAIVEAGLMRLGLAALPVDTLRETVPYLLGYPNGTAQRLVDEGRFARAVEVEMDVTVPDQGTGYFAILGTGKSRTKGKPEMYLRVRYVDDTGVTWREKVRVRSKEKVVLDERWVLGVRSRTNRPESASILTLTQQAVDALVARRLAS